MSDLITWRVCTIPKIGRALEGVGKRSAYMIVHNPTQGTLDIYIGGGDHIEYFASGETVDMVKETVLIYEATGIKPTDPKPQHGKAS